MLEVVQENEELPVAEKPREIVRSADRLRDLRGQEVRIRQACERHPEDTVAESPDEVGCDLQRQPGLPRAAGPGERQQPRAVGEHRDELLELALAADERARGDGQVRRIERP